MSKEMSKLQKIAGILKESTYEDQHDFYINVSVRDAKKAIEIIRDDFSREYRNRNIQLDGTNSYVINDRNIAIDLFDEFKENGIEIIDTDVEIQDSDFDGSSMQEDYNEDTDEYEDDDEDDDDDYEDEDDDYEYDPKAYVPGNIVNWITREIERKRVPKQLLPLVKMVATWADKTGKSISGGTTIGKNHDTLILDLNHQDSAIYIDIPNLSIKVHDERVRDFDDYEEAIANQNSDEDL